MSASASKKVIYAALVGNALIAITKFIASALTGSAAMLGLLVAFVGILLAQLTGIREFDGIASIVIGLILAFTALWMARETKGLLIGESADPKIVAAIESMIDEIGPIERSNEVLTMHMGPEYILVNISADFIEKASSDDVEKSIALLDKRIKEQYPVVKRIFVESESREHFLLQEEAKYQLENENH